jgi:uncharacterized OB-fold protein
VGDSLPTGTPHTSSALDLGPFWEAQHQNRLVLPRCIVCTTWHFPPKAICPSCSVGTMEWIEVSGKGTLYSLMIGHPEATAINAEPSVIAVIELAEGTRMMAELVGIEPNAPNMKVGMSLKAAFSSENDGGGSMPLKFQPA